MDGSRNDAESDAGPSAAATRRKALEALLDDREQTTFLDEGQWAVLTGHVVDASLSNDDATLEIAYSGLQWMSAQLDVAEAISTEVAHERGRVRGVLDMLRWQLRRSATATAPGLPREGLAARMLHLVAQHPGHRNQQIATTLGIDQTQVSRLGRHLRATDLATARRTGRENAWYVTPKGTACLQAIGLDPAPVTAADEVAEVAPSLPVEEAPDRALPKNAAEVLTSVLVNQKQVTGDVQEATGLPPVSVASAIDFLLRHGYLVREMAHSGAPGPLKVNEQQHRAIGISVRKGEVVGVLTTLRADDVRHTTLKVDVSEVPRLIRAVRTICSDLMRAEALTPSDVVGLGVNLPGHIDPRTGRVIYSPLGNPRQWQNLPLAAQLFKATGLPTSVDNDVNALALYEKYFGIGQGLSDFAVAFMTAEGEGIGSGLIVGGALVHGSTGSAGEIGHAPIGNHDLLCRCSNHGCLEAAVGFAAMQDRFERAGLAPPQDLPAASALVAQGDGFAREVFTSAGHAFGLGIATILNTLDPELLILSGPEEVIDVGSNVESATAFTNAARHTLAQHAFSISGEHCRIETKLLTGAYAARGAASALLLRHVYKSSEAPVDTSAKADSRLVPAAG